MKLKQVKGTVLSNVELLSYPGAKYFLMTIKAPSIAIESKPGQFFMLKCGNDTLLRRPISIHAATSSGEIQLLFAVKCKVDKNAQQRLNRAIEIGSVEGKGTLWLSELKKGAILDLIGPLGNGFNIEPTGNNILLVAGGIGIAPLKFLAEKALSLGKYVTLLIGARYKEGLYPSDLLPPGINSVRVMEIGRTSQRYKKGKVTDLLPGYLEWADQVFACGPEAMYEEMSKEMMNHPWEKPMQVSLEVRMGCGFGSCYSCSIKTTQGMKRVCKEGPVFNIKDIIWQEVRI